MDAQQTDTTVRLLARARAAVLAVEERRKPDDADPRSMRPLADAMMEERACVLAEVLGQAERRSVDTADAARPSDGPMAERALGAASDAAELDGDDPTGNDLVGLEPGAERLSGPEFVCSLAQSPSVYGDHRRMEDGEDEPSDLVRTEPWQDHHTEGVTSPEGSGGE